MLRPGAGPVTGLFLNDVAFVTASARAQAQPLQLRRPWSPYTSEYQPATWWLHCSKVHLGGVVANATRSAPIARLPTGRTPTDHRTFRVRSDAGVADLSVGSDGGLWWTGGPAGAWLSLSGVSFETGPADAVLPLATGMRGDPDWPPQLRNHSARVTLTGLVRVPAGATHIATIPDGYPLPPADMRVFATGNASVDVTVSRSGAITVAPGGVEQWVSLEGVAYPRSCWEESPVLVASGAEEHDHYFHYALATYDVWHRFDVPLEECKAVCEQLRCLSLQHSDLKKDGEPKHADFELKRGQLHCAVKAWDPQTAPPSALRHRVPSGTRSLTYVCPVPPDRPAWLSPTFGEPDRVLPTLSLVTPHAFTSFQVRGLPDGAHCFWSHRQPELFDYGLLPVVGAFVNIIAGLSILAIVLFALGAGLPSAVCRPPSAGWTGNRGRRTQRQRQRHRQRQTDRQRAGGRNNNGGWTGCKGGCTGRQARCLCLFSYWRS